MKIGISIIIPTKNNSSTLPALLSSIQKQAFSEYEIIVVDNWSEDSTAEIAERAGALVYRLGPERSAQRNFGASKANRETLLFLDSDMELSPGILNECAQMIRSADALCLREIIVSQKNYWGRARAFERECYFKSRYFEAARCLRKDVFLELSGYDTELTGLEDVALQAAIIEGRFKLGWIYSPVYHHEENISLITYLSKRKKYGKTDSIFAHKHPQYWKIIRSPIARTTAILRHMAEQKSVSGFQFVLGVLLMRCLEYSVRKQE